MIKAFSYFCRGVLSLAFTVFAACTSVNLDDPARSESLSLRISLEVKKTKAFSSKENIIDNVAILLFSIDEDENPLRLYECLDADSPVSSAGGYFFDVIMPLEKPDLPERLLAVLICNTDFNRIKDLEGKSFKEVSTSLNIPFSSSYCDSFSFAGFCNPVIDTSVKAHQLRASLIRDRARIDINASAIDKDIFNLTDIYVFRHSDLVAVLPLNPGTISVPKAASSVDKSKFEISPYDNISEGEVYIPEADLIMGGSGNPDDDNRLNRTAVVVGGFFRNKASKSYYRVDFVDAQNKLMDITRNHRYVINISDVRGAGTSTPEEAYSSVVASISASVLDWIRNDSFIVFDSSHWLSVESRKAVVGPDAGSSAILAFDSDIPVSDWKLAWSDCSSALFPVHETDQHSLRGDFFTITLPAENESELLFSARFPLPYNLSEVSERLHILAGQRLHLYVDIIQCDPSSTEWTDGGEIEGSGIFQ